MAGNGESSAATGEHRYVALLRGVNVGGKNRLPMADLRDIFTAAGCAAVRTYIQSGNVVFDAAHDLAEAVPEIVTLAIRRRFGYESVVVLRSGEELRQVVNSNPFDTSGDPRLLHVAFLKDKPGAEAVSRLDPEAFAPGRICGARAQCLPALPQRRSPQQADERIPCRPTANREHHAELADRPQAAGDGRRAVMARAVVRVTNLTRQPARAVRGKFAAGRGDAVVC